MALEPITRQEQIIAGKDLEPITRMEKFLKEYGGGGGASSWNDLEPFETVGGDTLTWDGNTEGLEVNDLGSGGAMLFYKVSSVTPALEDFANGGKLDFFDDDVTEITQDMLTSNNGAIFDTEMTFIIAHENEMGLSKGVWFNGAIAPIALTINGYTGFTTTKLKEEYIPVDYIKQLIAEVTGN